MPAAVETRVVELRRQRPLWGQVRVFRRLTREGTEPLPSARRSTGCSSLVRPVCGRDDGHALRRGKDRAGRDPLLNRDTCRLLARDFDGLLALMDALAYTKAARIYDVPTALEVSPLWLGSPCLDALCRRRDGHGKLGERARASCGGRWRSAASWTWPSYDRLFPAQDLLPSALLKLGRQAFVVAPLGEEGLGPGPTVAR